MPPNNEALSNSSDRLEALWERLADSIDRAGPEHELLFLSKLAFLLAREVPDAGRVDELIATALQDLT